MDLMLVRELAGGLYYGEPRYFDERNGQAANTMVYTASEVRRIAKVAFDLARVRRRHVVSVDKANVLEVSRLWRTVVSEVAAGYPEVKCQHMLVDRAAMELALRPAVWDVWLTGNLFGDILSDEAGAVVGSLGLLPSASLGDGVAIYEPIHGSAPDIAGKDVANPVGAIGSAAMMLRYSFGLAAEAEMVERAVEAALEAGFRTQDVAGNGPSVGTRAFTTAVLKALET
jgi:3-isopropylmalate dehydrogenase